MSCRSPDSSCMTAKTTPPWRRMRTSRPATPTRSPDRELPAARPDDLALRPDPVAQIEVGDVLEALLAQRLAGCHELQIAGLVLHDREDDAALAADAHEPSGHADALPRPRAPRGASGRPRPPPRPSRPDRGRGRPGSPARPAPRGMP